MNGAAAPEDRATMAAASLRSFHALTPDRWPDLEALFGERGACGGCWCMWWRLARKTFEASKGTKNKRAFQRLVKGGQEPGTRRLVRHRAARELSCAGALARVEAGR